MLYKELPAEGGTRNQNHGQFKIIQLSGSHPINKNIEMSNGIPEPWLIECFHIKINPVFTICMIIVWACPWLARFILLYKHILSRYSIMQNFTHVHHLCSDTIYLGETIKKKKDAFCISCWFKKYVIPHLYLEHVHLLGYKHCLLLWISLALEPQAA